MKKALIISNKIRKIPGGAIETVVLPLQELGFDVTWAANFNNIHESIENFPCNILRTESETNPFSHHNLITRNIILDFLDKNKVDVIFCSTPIGGLHGRLCGHKKHVPTIIYQAHGFLFFKGGPRLGFVFKLIEKWLAKYTSAIITINHEDFNNALLFKKIDKNKVFLVNGSGEDYSASSLSNEEKNAIKNDLKISHTDYVFISIGELNRNKNVIATVKAFNKFYDYKKQSKLIICGDGPKARTINKYIKRHKLENNILMLGYRTDVKKLIQISDCYVSTSFREGLSRTVGEAMCAGLPCIVSNKRGLSDLIDEKGGYLFRPNNPKEIGMCMNKIFKQQGNNTFSLHNKSKIKNYSSEKVVKQMKSILGEILNEGK